jgi:exosome complex component MTR3
LPDLQTGTVPAASGSAYYELEARAQNTKSVAPTIKLSCAVHGPKPLPRNVNFSPNLQLTASVKYAPFATRVRRGYIRDTTERDLGVHLENALRGLIIPDRWPKSSIDVAVTVLEGEDDEDVVPGEPLGSVAAQVGLMNILAGCITVATAALLDARIDSLDAMAGGVAATVTGPKGALNKILDPSAVEHDAIQTACVVGYLPARDEVVEVWSTGGASESHEDGVVGFDDLLDGAVSAAKAVHDVLKQVVLESVSRQVREAPARDKNVADARHSAEDIEMEA